jgi:ribose transport system ATP-binding protein
LIEIVHCVNEKTQILVVDETTTALSLDGREILYKLIHKMAEEEERQWCSFHMIWMNSRTLQCTHSASRWEIIGNLDKKEIDSPDAVKKIRYMMVGREIGDKYYRDDYQSSRGDKIALEIKGVSFGEIKDFNLTLYQGEIVGIGGLSGCGMHQVGRIAYGLDRPEYGSVIRNDKLIESPIQAVERGIGYISKNRDLESIILEGSIRDNIVLPSIEDLEKKTFISPKTEECMARKQIDSFCIKCLSSEQYVNTLSGGNKQKVSFAKWTAKGSDVLIMDCPTRGVDIGVKQFMYSMIEEMKHQGKTVLLIAEELSELLGMSDRIFIMKNFKIAKTFERSEKLKQTDVIEYMI